MTKRARSELTPPIVESGGSVIEVETLAGNLRFQFSGNIRVSAEAKLVAADAVREFVNARAIQYETITIDETNDRIDIDGEYCYYLDSTNINSQISLRDIFADSALLFVVRDPDHAEILLGDLVERVGRVRQRQSATVTQFWFWWQLSAILFYQIGARIRENTLLGRLSDALIRRIGR